MVDRASEFVQKGYGRPGIRLTESYDISIGDWQPERADVRLDAIHQFDKAHVVMLTEEGILSRQHGRAILEVLRNMESDGHSAIRATVGGGAHSAERYLVQELGEDVGGRIHLGRSSADLAAVGTRIAMRFRVAQIRQALAQVRRAVVSVARRELMTVMPGYTHGQHAQPITFAHWMAMWGSVFERDEARLRGVGVRLEESPAGAAAIAGSDFPLNRARTAELLGFPRPCANSIDAVHSHDVELECLAALAILGGNIGRLGDDLMQWSTAEFGLVELADRYCLTSSILAQKKNPSATQAMKAAAGVAIGGLMSAMYVNRGPTAESILEQGPGVQHDLWRTCELLTARLGELPDLLLSMELNRERMMELTTSHWALGADIAGALVRECELPWRTAHQIVGILVRQSIESGVSPNNVTPKMVDAAAIEYFGHAVGLSPQGLSSALDPVESVSRRTLAGGPAPSATTKVLDDLSERVEIDEGYLADEVARWSSSEIELENAIDSILT